MAGLAEAAAPQGELLQRIRGIWERSRAHAARSVNTAHVCANWLIGQQIVLAEQGGAARAGYGQALLKNLAERLSAVGVSPGPPLARDRWEAADWWFDQGASRLDLLPARGAAALWLEFTAGSRSAALLEVQWDGRALPPLAVAAGAASVRLPLEVSNEPHLLEIRVRAGDLRPAVRVRLE